MRVESDGDINAEHMCEHMKRAMVESTREVSGSIRVGENPKECVVER